MELSNQNLAGAMSDNEEEKNNDKVQKENEVNQIEEQLENEPIPDKNTAFQIFKSESATGKEIENGILETNEELKKNRAEAKEYLDQCSKFKSRMEELKSALNEKKMNKLNLGDDMTELIDEEGYKLIDELKGVKASYKEFLDKYKFAKSEINSLKSALDVHKVKYVECFENWFYKKYSIKIEDHELKIRKVRLLFIYYILILNSLQNLTLIFILIQNFVFLE